MNKVCFIVVTHFGEFFIERCLKSILNFENPLIIVVDNNSKDKTISIIEEKFKLVNLIKLNGNIGFGKANNIGIRKAKELGAKYIYLLNQDSYLHSGSIKNMVDLIDSNPDLAILSPIHLSGNLEKLDYLFQIYLNPNDTQELINDAVLRNLKPLYYSKFINAAAWLVPVWVFEKFGMFHPIFDHYGEDLDFILRVRKAGYKIGVSTNHFISHDRPQKKSGNIELKKIELKRRQLLAEYTNGKSKVKIRAFKWLIKGLIFNFLNFNWTLLIAFLKNYSQLKRLMKRIDKKQFESYSV